MGLIIWGSLCGVDYVGLVGVYCREVEVLCKFIFYARTNHDFAHKKKSAQKAASYLLILQPCQLTIPREGTEHDNGDTVEERISCEGPPVQQENL